MGLKITHTNKKNTSFPIQMLLDPEGKNVKNVSLSPNSYVYAREEFITSSLRVAMQRKFVSVLEGITIPDHIEYHVVYGPENPEPARKEPVSYVQTDIKVLSEEEHRKLRPEMYEHKPLDTAEGAVEEAEARKEKAASELVKEYAEEEPALKTGTWDEEEEKYLKRVYPRKGAKYVAEKLNRAEKSVYKKAENMKLKRRKS